MSADRRGLPLWGLASCLSCRRTFDAGQGRRQWDLCPACWDELADEDLPEGRIDGWIAEIQAKSEDDEVQRRLSRPVDGPTEPSPAPTPPQDPPWMAS